MEWWSAEDSGGRQIPQLREKIAESEVGEKPLTFTKTGNAEWEREEVRNVGEVEGGKGGVVEAGRKMK